LAPHKVNLKVARRTSRQLKSFTMRTKVTLRNDSETQTSILQVTTPDRSGLLAQLANIFTQFELILSNAKISTLGERVEDTFYIRDKNNQPITDEETSEQIKQVIRRELDSLNDSNEQESIPQSITIGQ